MPELAELALMRDFVNRHSANHIYHRITKSDCSTGKIGRSPLIEIPTTWNNKFKLHAMSRGKEMKAILINSVLDTMQVINELKQKQLQKDSADMNQLHNDNNAGSTDADNVTEQGNTVSTSDDNTTATDINTDNTTPIRQRTSSGKLRLVDRQSSTGVDKSSDIQPNYISVLFRAGMTGYWEIAESTDKLHKHAHLHLHRDDGKIIAFVDQRRFGSWHVNNGWDDCRGPCPVEEYEQFRAHVLANLHKSSFDACISDIMLDQRYFNGIGNYLRAEICYRANVNPFLKARDALIPLLTTQQKQQLQQKISKPALKRGSSTGIVDVDDSVDIDTEPQSDTVDNDMIDTVVTSQSVPWNDVLQLCNQLPREVFNLRFKYHNMESSEITADQRTQYTELLHTAFAGNSKVTADTDLSTLGFTDWLRCYDQDTMMKSKDKKSRAIYYDVQWKPKKYRPVKRNTNTSQQTVKTEVDTNDMVDDDTTANQDVDAYPILHIPHKKVGKFTAKLLGLEPDNTPTTVLHTPIKQVNTVNKTTHDELDQITPVRKRSAKKITAAPLKRSTRHRSSIPT